MHSMSFLKGVTAGLLVGAAVTMVCDPVTDRQRKRLHKKTEGVFKNIGGVVDTAFHLKKGMF